jgi:stage II sporulation SpoE-like protein
MQAPRAARARAVAWATLGCALVPLGGAVPARAHGLDVALPSVGVTVPGVGVTVPSVGVTLPGVSVKTPEVSVATPEVKVSTPEVSVTQPSSPGSGSETPSGGSTGGGSSGGGTSGGGSSGGGSSGGGSSGGGSSGGGSSGGGSSGGSSGGGSSGGGSSAAVPAPSSASGSATAASAAASGARATPFASVSTGTGRHSAGVVGKRSRRDGARSKRTPRASGGGGSTRVVRDAAGVGVLGGASASRPGGASPRRVASKPASNPLEAIGRHIPLPLPVPDWSKPIILALLALAIGFAVRSRRAVLRARRLESQRVTLMRDVDVMQEALVPEIPARVGGLRVSVAYRPAEGPAAGGDFYDVFAPARGKVAVILGDVAGHGHQALTQAALTRYTLRAYLQAGLEPRAALALAGKVLANPESERFATVVLAVYDTRDGTLTYASAGHPAPLVRGEGIKAPLEVCASPPIGWTVPTGRRQTTVSLPPGAVVCLFSDGLLEARFDDGELLGRERLDELLAALGPRPDAARLLARVRETAPITPDDMAACILAPEIAIARPRTRVEELEVEARSLSAGKVELFLEECEVAAAEIEPAIDRAGDIAAVWGSALLRVELDGENADVFVTAPRSEPRVAIPEVRRQPAGDPSGAC